MSDISTTIDTYLSAWSEPDATQRAAMIERVWTADGRLIDPPLTGEGHAGISEMAGTMQEQFPGHTFRRVSGIDAHHDQVRFAWELVGPDGTVALTGLDTGEVAGDGRLRRIVGYFGDLPAEDA